MRFRNLFVFVNGDWNGVRAQPAPELEISKANQDLLDACLKGNLEKAKAAIKAGADVNGRNSGGMTALMSASSRGKLDIVKILIANKADVNAKTDASDSKGFTALIYASLGGHLEK
jgi:ankyrin repeat protein